MTALMHVRWLALLAVVSLAGQACADEAPPLTSDTDKLSYALGMDLGSQLRRLSVEVDATIFGKALADGLAGGPTLIAPDEARVRIAALQDELKRRQAALGMRARENGAVSDTAPAPAAAGNGR